MSLEVLTFVFDINNIGISENENCNYVLLRICDNSLADSYQY